MSTPASGPTLYFRAPVAIDVTQPFGAVDRRIAERAITSRARRPSCLLWSSRSIMALVGPRAAAPEGGSLILVVMMAEGLQAKERD